MPRGPEMKPPPVTPPPASVHSDSFLRGWYAPERFGFGAGGALASPSGAGIFPAPPGIVPLAFEQAAPHRSPTPDVASLAGSATWSQRCEALGGSNGAGLRELAFGGGGGDGLAAESASEGDERRMNWRSLSQVFETYIYHLQVHIDGQFVAQEAQLSQLVEQVGEVRGALERRGGGGGTRTSLSSGRILSASKDSACGASSIGCSPPQAHSAWASSSPALPVQASPAPPSSSAEAFLQGAHIRPERSSASKDSASSRDGKGVVRFLDSGLEEDEDDEEELTEASALGKLQRLNTGDSAVQCMPAHSCKSNTQALRALVNTRRKGQQVRDSSNNRPSGGLAVLPASPPSSDPPAGLFDPPDIPSSKPSGRSEGVPIGNDWEEHIDWKSGCQGYYQWLCRLVASSSFDYAMGSIILLNTVLLGIQVDIKAREVSESSSFQEPFYFSGLETAFAAIFISEFLLRLAVAGRSSFRSFWMLFDFIVVASALIEEIIKYGIGGDTLAGKLSAFRLVRVLKIARTLRIIRLLRAFRELRLVVLAIWSCFRSLAWTLGLLFVLFYLMAILTLVELASATAPYSVDTPSGAFRKQYFPNIPRSLLTLFQTITGGVLWEEASAALEDIMPYYLPLWVIFIGFTVFAINNIVTGMFVHQAERVNMDDERNVLMEEKDSHEVAIAEMCTQLYKVDHIGRGWISRDRLMSVLDEKPLSKYCRSFDIDRRDVLAFFDLVTHHTNRLQLADAETFISGCFRLKGPAKNIDVVALTFQHREFMRRNKYDSERLKVVELSMGQLLEDNL